MTRMQQLSRILSAVAVLLAALPGIAGAHDFSLDLDIDYEYRYRTQDRLIETTAVKGGADLAYAFFDRPPLARLLLQGETRAGFGAISRASLRDQWTGDYFRTDNFPVVGVAGDPVRFENFFIDKAAVYYRRPGFEFLFGREQPDYNGILNGGLLPGTRLPYLDAVRASGRIGRMRIEWMVASIPSIKSWEAFADPSLDVNPNQGVTPSGAQYYGFEAEPASTNPNSTMIVEAMNRLTWELGRFTIGLTDHAMLARRENRFYITDFIPVISRHQASIAQTNNSMVLEAAWKPVRGLRLAAQAGFDDINASFAGVSDAGIPTIDAYVAGADYRAGIGGGTLHVRAEAGYTHWLWGNYDGSQIWPNDVNPFLRFQYRYLTDSGALLLPLTSPYGPGATWVNLDAGFAIPLGAATRMDIGLDFLYLAKNTQANLIDTALIGNTTTAGAPVVQYISLALPLRLQAGAFNASARPGLALRDGDPWFELSLGAGYRLRYRRGGN